jgi:hypothetical protein
MRRRGSRLPFRNHTGIGLADFFVVGAAVQARFSTHPGAALVPGEYFNSTGVTEEVWGPFFRLLGRDLAGFRVELEDEETRYGPTTTIPGPPRIPSRTS